MDIQDLARDLAESYSSYIDSTWTREPQSVARASSIGFSCLTRHALDIHMPNGGNAPDVEKKGILWTGKMTEYDTATALTLASKYRPWDVVEAQEPLHLIVSIPKADIRCIVMTGHIDFRIEHEKLDVRPPLELKTLRAEIWEKVEDGNLDSLLGAAWFLRSWVDQAQAYAMMSDSPHVILMVLSKQHRMAKVFVVHADDKRQSVLTQRAIEVFMLQTEKLEDTLAKAKYLPAECPGCPYFKGACPVERVSPQVALQDEVAQQQLLELLDRKETLETVLKPLNQVAKDIQKQLKSMTDKVKGVTLPDGTTVNGKEIIVGPRDGYTFWKSNIRRPKGHKAQPLTPAWLASDKAKEVIEMIAPRQERDGVSANLLRSASPPSGQLVSFPEDGSSEKLRAQLLASIERARDGQ